MAIQDPSKIITGYMQAVEHRLRRWPVTVAGLYLLLQALILVSIFPVLAAIQIAQQPELSFDALRTPDGRLSHVWVEVINLRPVEISLHIGAQQLAVTGSVLSSMIFALLAGLVFVCGILFFLPWRGAWALAVSLEAVILTLGLVIYINMHHRYIYLVLINAIFMVFVLNQNDVETFFEPRPVSTQPDLPDES